MADPSSTTQVESDEDDDWGQLALKMEEERKTKEKYRGEEEEKQREKERLFNPITSHIPIVSASYSMESSNKGELAWEIEKERRRREGFWFIREKYRTPVELTEEEKRGSHGIYEKRMFGSNDRKRPSDASFDTPTHDRNTTNYRWNREEYREGNGYGYGFRPSDASFDTPTHGHNTTNYRWNMEEYREGNGYGYGRERQQFQHPNLITLVGSPIRMTNHPPINPRWDSPHSTWTSSRGWDSPHPTWTSSRGWDSPHPTGTSSRGWDSPHPTWTSSRGWDNGHIRGYRRDDIVRDDAW